MSDDTTQATLSSTSSESSNDSDSSEQEYSFELTDIRGVGEKTVEKLSQLRINGVSDLHLIRPDRQTVRHRAERGDIHIPNSTWDHLEAVGQAIRSGGSRSARSKHFTHPEAESLDDFVSVDVTSLGADSRPSVDDLGDDTEEPTFEFPEEDELAEALDMIRDRYGDTYSDELSLTNRMGDFQYECKTGFDELPEFDHGDMKGILYYGHSADRVMGGISPREAQFLVAFTSSSYLEPDKDGC